MKKRNHNLQNQSTSKLINPDNNIKQWNCAQLRAPSQFATVRPLKFCCSRCFCGDGTSVSIMPVRWGYLEDDFTHLHMAFGYTRISFIISRFKATHTLTWFLITGGVGLNFRSWKGRQANQRHAWTSTLFAHMEMYNWCLDGGLQ